MPDELRQSRLIALAHQSLAQAEPPYLRHYPGARFESRDGLSLVASPLPGPGFNYVAALGGPFELSAVLAVGEAFFGAPPGNWGVLVEGGAGGRLEAQLQAARFSPAEDEPAFVMPDPPPGPRAPCPPLVVRIVADAALLDDFRTVTCAAFGAPPEMARDFSPDSMIDEPRMGFVVGYLDDRPVAAAMTALAGGGATIAGVGVLPEYRGRGFGAAVTWAAIDEGLCRGARYASLRSGPLSIPLYTRIGFEYACQHVTYAPSEPSPESDG